MPRTTKGTSSRRRGGLRKRVPSHRLSDLVALDGALYAATSDGRVHKLVCTGPDGREVPVEWQTLDPPVPGTRHDHKRTPSPAFPNTLERAALLADALADALLSAIKVLPIEAATEDGMSVQGRLRARLVRTYNLHSRELARPSVPENLEDELEAEA